MKLTKELTTLKQISISFLKSLYFGSKRHNFVINVIFIKYFLLELPLMVLQFLVFQKIFLIKVDSFGF